LTIIANLRSGFVLFALIVSVSTAASPLQCDADSENSPPLPFDVGDGNDYGNRKLDGLGSLEGEGQERFHCFTKDAPGAHCEKLAICLWDGGEPGDDLIDPHGRAGREWSGGIDPGTEGTEPMDIMWRFMQRSVGVPY